MIALMVALNGKMKLIEIPAHFRGGQYLISSSLGGVSINFDTWIGPTEMKHRVFVWRMQVARADGSPMFDLFEEVE